MKKTYQKPLLYAETFQLVEHISTDCAVSDMVTITPTESAYNCYYADGGRVVYMNSSACGDSYVEELYGSWDTYFAQILSPVSNQCYTAFLSSANKPFSS